MARLLRREGVPGCYVRVSGGRGVTNHVVVEAPTGTLDRLGRLFGDDGHAYERPGGGRWQIRTTG